MFLEFCVNTDIESNRRTSVEGMYSACREPFVERPVVSSYVEWSILKKTEQCETTLRNSAVHHSAVLRFAVQPWTLNPWTFIKYNPILWVRICECSGGLCGSLFGSAALVAGCGSAVRCSTLNPEPRTFEPIFWVRICECSLFLEPFTSLQAGFQFGKLIHVGVG